MRKAVAILPLVLVCLSGCYTLYSIQAHAPRINTVSSHDVLLTAAKTFGIMVDPAKKSWSAEQQIVQTNLEKQTAVFFQTRGLTSIDLTKPMDRYPDVFISIAISANRNDYGRYFPRIELTVIKLNDPNHPENAIPIWSGTAERMVDGPNVSSYFRDLLEQLCQIYPE